MTRRDFLWQSGGGLGGIAFASLLGTDRLLADGLPKRPDGGLHHAPKAKRVVQLFMAGGASHVDLFDYKPELVKRHGQAADFGEKVEAFQNGLGPWSRPFWDFKPYGRTGSMLSEVVAPLGDVSDEIAFVHNMVGKSGVHSQGTLLQTTGFNRPGFPGMGCWASYGLGSGNENLPTFVVLPDHRGLASNGTKNWDSAFLPAQHQGSAIYPGSPTPVEDLFPDPRSGYVTKAGDKAGLGLLNALNRGHAASRPGDDRLDAPDPQLRAGRADAAGRPGGARPVGRAEARPRAVRAGPRQVVVRPGDQRRGGGGQLRPPLPGGPAAAGARRPLRAGLERATTTASRGGTGTATRT